MHHEQTYDILADARIPWPEKKRWTDRAVRYYLTRQTPGIAQSCAPLDVTMRRAGLMMKPYFTCFRNDYPKDQTLFVIAHWWHPAIYESMMIAGNGPRQEQAIAAANLSRELMPRDAMMPPESANIFDNLPMLHGTAYDILAYEGWDVAQKRAEMYRVIHAMGYQGGDEALARNFALPRPPGMVVPRLGMARLHLNAIWSHNYDPLRTADGRERRDRYLIGIGYSQPVTNDAVLVADVYRQPLRERGRAENTLEVGTRYQLTLQTMLSGSIGTGFGDRSPAVRVLIGFQHALSWPLLFR